MAKETIKIEIDDDFYLTQDVASWNLHKINRFFSEKFQEERTSVEVSYYANIKQALIAYLDLSLKGSTSFEEILTRLKHAEDRINKMEINL